MNDASDCLAAIDGISASRVWDERDTRRCDYSGPHFGLARVG